MTLSDNLIDGSMEISLVRCRAGFPVLSSLPARNRNDLRIRNLVELMQELINAENVT
jgi:hypothetical protein